MSTRSSSRKPFFLGAYQFCDPAPLSTKNFLPFGGVYAIYSKNPTTGYLKLRFIGETENLEASLSFTHPVYQKLLKDANGNKELLFYAYHINLSEPGRQKIVKELVDRFNPQYNQQQTSLMAYVEDRTQTRVKHFPFLFSDAG